MLGLVEICQVRPRVVGISFNDITFTLAVSVTSCPRGLSSLPLIGIYHAAIGASSTVCNFQLHALRRGARAEECGF